MTDVNKTVQEAVELLLKFTGGALEDALKRIGKKINWPAVEKIKEEGLG